MFDNEKPLRATSLWDSTLIKLSLGFAALAVTAALTIGPSADRLVANIIGPDLDRVDPITTATVRPADQAAPESATKRYIVRRSVLQKTPGSTCRIFVSGRREGDC